LSRKKSKETKANFFNEINGRRVRSHFQRGEGRAEHIKKMKKQSHFSQ